MASGIVKCYKHAIRDGWSSEGFRFRTGSVARSAVMANTTRHYGFPERFAVLSSDSLSASVQVPMSDTPPGMLAR